MLCEYTDSQIYDPVWRNSTVGQEMAVVTEVFLALFSLFNLAAPILVEACGGSDSLTRD